VSAADLTNTGTITIEGGSAGQAALIVNDSAPSTWAGELDISGNGLLQFGSGGITAIDSGASINLSGPHARVALSGAPSSNSALAELASNDGQLELLGGFLTTTTDFLNSGTLLLDDTTGGASGAITFGGTLNNSGFVQVGNAGMTASTALTAAGLGNIGSIVLTGSSANDMAIMTVNGDASNDGSIDIGSFADLQIAGALSGFGDVTVEVHSTLELGGASDSTVTFNGLGAKLKVDNPALFTGTLSNFGLDDVLDFGTFTVDSATLLGSTLDITIGGDDYFYATDGVPDGAALIIVDGGHGVELTGPVDRWTEGVDGSWFDGANWTTGLAPQAGEHAIIDAPGFYTVTLDGQAEVDDLDLASSGATLRLPNFESRLTVDGTLTVASGTLDLEGLGTIAGGVIANAGGSFLFNQGRLDGVTIEGTLDLSGEAANLSVTNGITLLGAGGVGDGDVELTGAGLIFASKATQRSTMP
jgi:hypothetical protein